MNVHSGATELADRPESAEDDVSVEEVGYENDGQVSATEAETENAEDLLTGGMMIRNVNGVWMDAQGREFMPDDGHDGMTHDLALKAELLTLEIGGTRTKEAFGQTLEGDDVIFQSTYTMTSEGLQFSWGQREVMASDLAKPTEGGAADSPGSSLEAPAGMSTEFNFELSAPTESPDAAPKPAESLFAIYEPKTVDQPTAPKLLAPEASGQSEPKPEPKPKRKAQLWKSLSESEPETTSKSKPEMGPLDYLRTPDPAAPKPPKLFEIPEAEAKPPQPEVKKGLFEAEKPKSEAVRSAPKTEQAKSAPDQPATPEPPDSPEPTGGRAADQPVEDAANDEAANETPSIEATVAETAAVDAEAAQQPLDLETTQQNVSEASPVVSERAPAQTQTVTAETTIASEAAAPESLEASPVEADQAVAETAPADTTGAVHETKPVIIESTIDTATTSEQAVVATAEAPATSESEFVAKPEVVTAPDQIAKSIDESQLAELVAEQPTAEISDDAVTLETPASLQEVTESRSPVEITLEQPTAMIEIVAAPEAVDTVEEVIQIFEDSETVLEQFVQEMAPSIVQTAKPAASGTKQSEPAVQTQEQPAISFENDLSEEFAYEPAELNAAPAAASSTAPPTAVTSQTDTTVQTSEEGLNITMALDEPAEAPRRQTRTRPSHMTVGSLPTEPTVLRARTEMPPTPIEIPMAAPEIPVAPVEIPPVAVVKVPPVTPIENAFTRDLEILPEAAPVAPVQEALQVVEPTAPIVEINLEATADTRPEPAIWSPMDTIVEQPAELPLEETPIEQPIAQQVMHRVVQNSEPTFQPVIAKLQPHVPEVQSWADDFGAVNLPPALDNHMDPAITRHTVENSLRAPFGTAQTTGQISEDDDPGVVISFDQSEDRRAARRAHTSRSAAA